MTTFRELREQQIREPATSSQEHGEWLVPAKHRSDGLAKQVVGPTEDGQEVFQLDRQDEPVFEKAASGELTVGQFALLRLRYAMGCAFCGLASEEDVQVEQSPREIDGATYPVCGGCRDASGPPAEPVIVGRSLFNQEREAI